MDVKVREEDIVWVRNLKGIEDSFRRQLAIGSIITNIFSYNGLEKPILVGGSVVAIYSAGQYKTVDLDMKAYSVSEYNVILKELGYTKLGKDFYNGELDSYVEFPSGVMEDSMKHVRELIIEETELPLYVLGFEDIIIDRVCSFYATNDQDSKEWALRLMGALYDDIDWSYLHGRSNELGILKITEKLQRNVKRYKRIYELMNNETSASVLEKTTMKTKFF